MTSRFVRRNGCSSESGLTRRTARRRSSSAGRPSASSWSVADERVAEHLDQPGLGQRARDRATGALPRRQAGARPGRRAAIDGIASYPRRRATSSTRSTPTTRSGRHDGGVHRDRVGTGVADLAADRRAASRAPRRPCTARRRAAPAGRAASSNDGTGTRSVDVGERGVGDAAAVLDEQRDRRARPPRAAAAGRHRARTAWPPRWAACAGARCARP